MHVKFDDCGKLPARVIWDYEIYSKIWIKCVAGSPL